MKVRDIVVGGRGLHELAESEGADLLVLDPPAEGCSAGCCWRSCAGRLERGSVRGRYRPSGLLRPFRPDQSDRRRLRRIARKRKGARGRQGARGGASRRALGVYRCVGSAARDRTGSAAGHRCDRAALHNARERIAELGGVTPLAGYGPPVEVLASYSESVDLLVVGSRGYGPIGRLVHGSTSDELARSARSALLVLPRSAPSVARTRTRPNGGRPKSTVPSAESKTRARGSRAGELVRRYERRASSP